MDSDFTFKGKKLRLVRSLSQDLVSAEDSSSGLKYTVKNICGPTPQRLQNLNKEIKLLKSCKTSHPNILSLFFIENNSNCTRFFYEHCNQGSLFMLSDLPILTIFQQICAGVSYLHSNSVIHNNLNIYNILVNDNIPKIAGLEIATEEELLMDRNDSVNRNYLEYTLPEWRAPELRENFVSSKESDIWNLGLVLFYMIYKKNYDFDLPKNVPQHFKDLFLMTLEVNPSKRAGIKDILKKIEERSIGSPMNIAGCSCFCSRRLLSSSVSTLSLVQKAINSPVIGTTDENLQKLITKVWKSPEKIPKFYFELLRLQDLNNETQRIKAYCLLFLYLQKAPISAFNHSPGVLQIITRAESFAVYSSKSAKNEYFLRISHLFSVVIQMKYYVVKSNIPNFNGKFVPGHLAAENYLKSPQQDLVGLLNEYWEVLLKFQELLLYKSQHEDLRRSIRISVSEEQVYLLKFMNLLINNHKEAFENSETLKNYAENAAKGKRLFENDQILFPSIVEDLDLQILIGENDFLRGLDMSSEVFEHKINSPDCGKFTPVDLDNMESSVFEDVKFPTEYATAQKDSNSSESKILLDSEASLDKLQVTLQNWNICVHELTFLNVIGCGSSSEVWLGLYHKTQVAIKRQKSKEIVKNKEFGREVKLLLNLRHPNLVIFMGVSLEPPISIITEYCAGGDLFKLLHKKKEVFVTWQQKIKILQEIAKGMNFLHFKNFIHRDLKSLNILMCSEIVKANDPIYVKISDFGLSRKMEEGEFMTGSIGTCHWMAPEVLNASMYTSKADVYSFAIVMYEVITREVPYKGKKNEEIRTEILLNQMRPDLQLVSPSCPSKLKNLMISCWNQDPNKRPNFSAILDILSTISVSSR